MKERLTGAIILVALIVLLVPELLTGPVRPAAGPVVAASSPEEPPLSSYTIHLTDEPHPATGSSSDAAPAVPQPSGPSQPTSAPPPTGAASLNEPSAGPQPTSPPSSRPADAAAGPQPATAAPRPLPPASSAPDRAAAKAGPARKSAKAVPQRVASAPASPPAATSSGYVVQLGVFASRGNADHLGQEMRAKGFKTAISESGNGAQRRYRVRVGPAPDRAAAQELSARLRAAGHPGTVIPLS